MLTINSYQIAEHVENKIILFNTAFKHIQTHGSYFTANFWQKSVPHWSTSIIKGLFPLIVIPKWEDKYITRLSSGTFWMNWGCKHKLWWEVRWYIVMKTFKNNYKKLFIPSFMQFIPAKNTHHIGYGCSDIGGQKNPRKFVLKNLERIWEFRNAFCSAFPLDQSAVDYHYYYPCEEISTIISIHLGRFAVAKRTPYQH